MVESTDGKPADMEGQLYKVSILPVPLANGMDVQGEWAKVGLQ